MSQKNNKAIRKWANKYHDKGKDAIKRAKETLKKLSLADRIKFLKALRKSV